MSAEATSVQPDHPGVAILAAAWMSALAEVGLADSLAPDRAEKLASIARPLIGQAEDSAVLPEAAWGCGVALAALCGPHPRALGALSAALSTALGAIPTLAPQFPTILGYLATGFVMPHSSKFGGADHTHASQWHRGPEHPVRATQDPQAEEDAPLAVPDAIPCVMWITDETLRPISIDGEAAKNFIPLLHGQAALPPTTGLDEANPIEALRKAHLTARGGAQAQFRVLVGGCIYRGWIRPLRGNHGVITGCVGVALDISPDLPVTPPDDDRGPWYQELVEAIDGVVWETNLETNRYTYVSPRAVALLGYPIERWLNEENFWFQTAHPDDAANIRHTMLHTTEIKPTYQIEYRARTADGRWIWLCNGFTIIREEGQPIRARGVMMDVTQYKQTEQALRESEERFRAVFDNAGIGIALIDADGDVTHSNAPLQRMLGRGEEELRGRSLTELSHPDDMWISRPLFDAIVRGERDSFHQEKRYLHKNGRVVWANLVTTAMREPGNEQPEVICIIEDATDRKQIEMQLQHQLGLTQAIIASFRGGLCALDREGKATYINPAAEQILGWREEELLGGSLLDILAPAERGQAHTSWHAATQRGQIIAIDEAQFVKKDGMAFPVGYTLSPIIEGGEVMGAVLGFRELTEQKRLQAELTTVNRLVAESREEAQQHLARELHDGALQLLIGISYQMGRRLATTPDQEMREMRQSVLDVVVQLRGLLGELRPAGLEELGLATALEGYVSRLQRETGADGPEMVLDVVETAVNLPLPTARCIFRVAQEGLRNILRHAEAKRVDLQLRVVEEEATLTIRDDGIGFNVPPSLSALTRSNHFGLVGMAERVALADGQLSIRSQLGHGTAIFLRLPLVHERADEPKPKTAIQFTPLFDTTPA